MTFRGNSNLVTDLVSSAKSGLIVGLDLERIALFLVPTPANPSAEKQLLDKDWIVEHAFQISRMLTGNLEILGIFLVASNFEQARLLENQLHQVVKSVTLQRKATSLRKTETSLFYILEISSADKSSRVIESDIRQKPDQIGQELSVQLQAVERDIHTFEARVSVDVEVPLRSGIRSPLREQIRKGLQPTVRNLQSALATIDGEPVPEAQLLSSLKSKVHSVELYCDLFAATVDSPTDGALESVVRYSGTISARAFCLSNTSLQTALDRLKSDVIESIYVRIEALCEEYAAQKKGPNLDASSLQEANLRGKEEKWILPRRVFVPIQPPVMLSDYLSAEETLQDCEARCVELIGVKPPPGNIENWLVPGESLFATPKPTKATTPASLSAPEKGAKVKHELQAKMASLEQAKPTIPTRIYGAIALAVLAAIAAFYFQYWLVSHYRPE